MVHAEKARARTLAVLLVTLVSPLLWPIERAQAWCQMVSGNIRPTATEPCVLAESHEGIYSLAWRRRCTSISVSDAAPPRDFSPEDVQQILRTGFDAWQTADCGGAPTGLAVEVLTTANTCIEASHYNNGRNANAVMFVREGWSSDRGHDPRAYAVTFVWHDPSSGEIYDADIEVNEQRGEYAVCPELGCDDGRIDLPNVLTHELGHYFGLAHTPDDVNATMWSMAPPGEIGKRTLAPDDVTGICSMYPAGTLSEACDPTPRGGEDLTCSPPSSCGCAAPGAGATSRSALAALGLLALASVARRRRR